MPKRQPTKSNGKQEEFSTLGFKVSKALRDRIKAASVVENRSESSFARHHLGRVAEEVLSATSNTSEQ